MLRAIQLPGIRSLVRRSIQRANNQPPSPPNGRAQRSVITCARFGGTVEYIFDVTMMRARVIEPLETGLSP